MLEELFIFPVVMIDGDNEERKQHDKERLSNLLNKEEVEEEEDYDILYGEAEYPYWDFVGIEDRWLPTKESLQKALEGKFEACIVKFINIGQLLVPWTKKKFKAEIKKFAEEYATRKPSKDRQVKVITLSPEQVEKIMKDGEKSDEE